MANGESGADQVITVRFVAQDDGLTQTLGAVHQALDKTKEKVSTVSDAAGGFEEMVGQHSTRAVKLLAGGIAQELDPALASLLSRVNAATLGVRLFGEGLSIPMMIGIGTAVAGLTLFIAKINELSMHQAKLNLAMSALDTGPIVARLTELALQFEQEKERAKSWSGAIINEFARAAREIMNFQVPSIAARAGAGLVDMMASGLQKLGIGTGKPLPSEMMGKIGGEDPRITRQREALEAWDVARPAQYRKELAQLALTYDQIKASQAAIPPPLFIAQGLTLAQEATLQYNKMSAALKQVAADQAVLARTETMFTLAAMLKPLGGPESPQYQTFAKQQQVELTKRLAGIQETYKTQLMGLQNVLEQTLDPIYTGLVAQARGAGFTVGSTFTKAYLEAVAEQTRQRALAPQFVLGTLGVTNPNLAELQRTLFQTYEEMRNLGYSPGPLGQAVGPGGEEVSLTFPENPILGMAAQMHEFAEKQRRAVLDAMGKGGPSAAAAQEELNALEKQAQTLGVAWTEALMRGLQGGIERERGIRAQQLGTKGMMPGFEKMIQEQKDALVVQLRDLGLAFSPETILSLATSRVQEQRAQIGEEAMIAKLFGGIMANVVAAFERAGAGTGQLGTIVSQRMVSLITKEIGRAGLDPGLITEEIIMAMIQARQAESQATVIEQAALASFLKRQVQMTIDAVLAAGIGTLGAIVEEAKGKARQALSLKVAQLGLSNILSGPMIDAMRDAEQGTAGVSELERSAIAGLIAAQTARIVDMFRNARIGLTGYAPEGLAEISIQQQVDKLQTDMAKMGYELSRAQLDGLKAGFEQARQDKIAETEIQATGPRSFLRTMLGEARTIRIEAENLGITAADGFFDGLLAGARTQQKREGMLTENLTAQMDADIKTLERMAQDFRTSMDAQAAAGLEAGLRSVVKDLSTFGKDVEDGVKQVGATLQRGLSDSIFNITTGQFGKLADAWTNFWQGLARIASDITARLIERMILQWMEYEQTMTGLKLLPTGGMMGGGAGWSWLMGLLGLGGGTAATGGELLGPAFATGGIVTRPTRALIGEAGPEAVVPLSQMGKAGLGGGVTVINLMKEEDLAGIMAGEVAKGRQVVVNDVVANMRNNSTMRRANQRFR